MPSWARRALVAGICSGLLLTPQGSDPSWAAVGVDELVLRPASGVLEMRGHGWGHGIGMSQYGALGGAQAGATASTIVRTYYPGTTLGTVPDAGIRVRIASLGSSVPVQPESSLSLYDGTSWRVLRSIIKTGEQPVTGWRLVPEPTSPTLVRIEYLTPDYTTWQHFTTSTGSMAAFGQTSSGTVTTTRSGVPVLYRGELRGIRLVSGGDLTPVVALPMESYLRSVVPSEMPAAWPAAAVQSQVIAARSFAEFHRRYAPLSASYDVYDDTRSQVFRGTRVGSTLVEHPLADTAVAATAHTVVLDNAGAIAFTQFSSSSGGWTATGSKPYLTAHADPWDAVSANPNHSWTTTITVAAMERAFPQVGRFSSLRITSRTGNGELRGRVDSLTINGSLASVRTTGDGLRSALGLKSNWFAFATDGSFPRDVTGDAAADILSVVAATGALRVYRGDGQGGLSALPDAETGAWASVRIASTAGAFGTDRVSDLVIVGSDGSAYLRPGRGDGTFGTPVRLGRGWSAYDAIVPVGDFDRDGAADLLTRRAADGALVLHRGSGTGTIRSASVVGTGWQIFTQILGVGDFDGDGAADVMARGRDGVLHLYPGNGSGGWRARRVIGSGWGIFTALTAPGDVDGDGAPDVVARTSSGVLYLYPGTGTGGWRPPRVVGTGWQIFSSILR